MRQDIWPTFFTDSIAVFEHGNKVLVARLYRVGNKTEVALWGDEFPETKTLQYPVSWTINLEEIAFKHTP